jgi:hypothetical protein
MSARDVRAEGHVLELPHVGARPEQVARATVRFGANTACTANNRDFDRRRPSSSAHVAGGSAGQLRIADRPGLGSFLLGLPSGGQILVNSSYAQQSLPRVVLQND